MTGVYGVWAFNIPGGFEFVARATLVTIIAMLTAQFLATAIRRVIERSFALGDDVKLRFPTLEAQANRYVPILQALLRYAINFLAVLVVLQAWGIDTFNWLTSPLGQRLAAGIAKVALLAAIAFLLVEIMSAFVERYMSRREATGNPVAVSGRARTLLPLMRRVVLVALWAVVVLVMLSEIGIDIGPLLAGAGIIGLAVGFGAQTLVKDVITGVFILLEDQMAVGDVVKVGGRSGIVESISIRTIRLRDVSGSVHMIPFSEVGSVENMSKDFSYYLLDVGVSYQEDTDRVAVALEDVAEDLRADAAFGPSILVPLEIMGVERFTDTGVVIRARIKTRPLKQWAVGREFNRRMKKMFEARGIQVSGPPRTIFIERAVGSPAQPSAPSVASASGSPASTTTRATS
ncbi:MAG: mechanosensitive ion channel [Alphaproteobacteria bacterium]|nr:mechanosensitive ion channel [Alphaproteobacteria bacterium]